MAEPVRIGAYCKARAGERVLMNCGDSIRVVHPLFQEEGGGSSPTSPLQLNITRIHPKKAAARNRQWHSRLPEIANWQVCEAYAAESNNIYYAVALWSYPSNQTGSTPAIRHRKS